MWFLVHDEIKSSTTGVEDPGPRVNQTALNPPENFTNPKLCVTCVQDFHFYTIVNFNVRPPRVLAPSETDPESVTTNPSGSNPGSARTLDEIQVLPADGHVDCSE